MRSLLFPLVFSFIGLAANSEPILSRRILHEQRSHIPSGWKLARKHDASAVIPLRFALKQSNLENIHEYLDDVSHPDSPDYGKHWSAGKVASTFAPSRDAVDAVRNWLLESGIESHRIQLSASRGWLGFDGTVQEAENLLQASYNVYGHDTGVEHIACERYHLPEHLAHHVDFVIPSVHFDARLFKRSGSGKQLKSVGSPGSGTGPKTTKDLINWTNRNWLADCDTHITPLCLRALYRFHYKPVVPEKNSYGIVEYTPQSYRQEDLDMFARNFSSDLCGVSPVLYSVDGGALSTDVTYQVNGESNLDLEYAMNLVTSKQRVSLYEVGDAPQGASFNNFLDAIDGSYCTFEGGDDLTVDGIYPDTLPGGYDSKDCGTVKLANVISTSYGYNEADTTIAYASRQCAEYAKLGLMGITMLFSSGDDGVAGTNANCLNADGSQSLNGTIFNPSFPSTCPFVTSIGATQISPGKTVHDDESACVQTIYSGGGFSNYFAIPNYQKHAVKSYLKNSLPPYPSSVWNSTGNSRAYPDISANGANYVIALDGNFSLVCGTSASAPVVGAMLTMINDARIARNKSTIGFINPVIYSAYFSDGFNDITNGTNPGCGTLGFNTSYGWDPVTGLGTLNFPRLLAKWVALP